MIRLSAVLAGVLVLCLVTWLAAGIAWGPAPAESGPPQGTGEPSDRLSDSIRRQAERLHAYLQAPPRLPPPARNPFRFRERGVTAADRVAVVPPAAAALSTANLPRVARPDLRLVGIAEDAGPDGPVRTAVISGAEQLFTVKAGERVLGRYLVVRIGTDVVELTDGEGGPAFRLALR